MRVKLSARAELLSPIPWPASANSRVEHSVIVVQRPAKPIVRWAFYAFVFSLLFEAAPVLIPLEVTRVTGAFLFLAALLQPRLCFRWPPKAFWCFAGYFYAVFISIVAQNALLHEGVIYRQLVFVQLMVMFWITYNLMRCDYIARGALKSLILSCAALSVLQLCGLTTTVHERVLSAGRFTAFGIDPNQLAGILVLGLLALIASAHILRRELFQPRLVAWPLIILLCVTLVQTGSRGGLLALMTGLLTFALGRGMVTVKIRNMCIMLLGIVLFLGIAYQSEIIKNRFAKTIEGGDVTARDRIYTSAWDMFLERPLMGWGPVLNRIEIAERVQIPRFSSLDAHNLILNVLTTAGLLGALPFFVGIWLCLQAAWRARAGAYDILPLALAVSVLTASMSVSGIDWKQFWLILAFTLASNNQIVALRRHSILT